jgi:hypothetical protein
MTSQLILRSIDRDNPLNTNAGSFRLLFPVQPISGNYAITEVSLTNASFNLNANNSTLIYTDASTHTVTIPPGFYSPTSLASVLAMLMSTASGTAYTATVDPNSYIISIVGSGVFTLNFSQIIDFYSTNHPFATLAMILGFPPGADVTSNSSFTVIGSFPVDPNWNSAYYVTIKSGNTTNTRAMFAGKGAPAVTFPILIDQAAGSTITYRPHNTPRVNFHNASNMEIVISDDSGQTINPQGGEIIIIAEKV